MSQGAWGLTTATEQRKTTTVQQTEQFVIVCQKDKIQNFPKDKILVTAGDGLTLRPSAGTKRMKVTADPTDPAPLCFPPPRGGPAGDVNVIPTRGQDNGWIFWTSSVVVRFSPLSQAFHGKAHPSWSSEREGFHSQPPLSTRRLTLGPDGRASLQPGSTHEATRGVSGRCWPRATHGHPAGPPLIWPSCAGALELIHKNVPFGSDWLPVTS